MTTVGERRNIEAEMVDELNNHYASNRPPPEGMPPAIRDAAQWFLELIEPYNPVSEKPQKVSIPYRDAYRWEEPYANRVMSCLRRYLRAEQSFQRYILAAAQDGIYWRGDSEYIFRMVVSETERMREMGVDAYREMVLNRLSAVNAKIGTQ